ncbi:MAG: NUDIX hydrolase [Planctomycetes bacterium]|nr:NUDIX hydrolase [Planctomycetota bacterium]
MDGLRTFDTSGMTRTHLLTTRLFSVEHREFPRPGRPPIGRDVVVHPGAVVILPLLSEQQIVMIRNFRYTVERALWELPAGTREPNESPLETAKRELEEETGYRAAVMSPFLEFYPSPGILTERMYVFAASELTQVGQGLQDNEQITVEVVGVDVARERLVRGEFEDAKTIATLATYFLRNAPRRRGT